MWIVGALLFIVAVILGGLRYAGVTTDNPTQNATLFSNPLVYIVINIVLICSSAYYIFLYYPSMEEIKYCEDYKKMKDDLSKKNIEVKAKEQELEALKESKNAVARYRLQMRHYQAILLQRIEAMYQESIANFFEINTKMRTDHVFPLAFNQPIPPLDINNEDEKVSNFLKHNNNEN
ncbi:MAG: hypothetical protein JWN78_2024 [Bacteroidota bacterium]|nr:hypothetical protein [Bacteroidota bacterium]